jgi:hypothetical protein
MNLVDWCRLYFLDRARFDDGQQSLCVPTWTSTNWNTAASWGSSNRLGRTISNSNATA